MFNRFKILLLSAIPKVAISFLYNRYSFLVRINSGGEISCLDGMPIASHSFGGAFFSYAVSVFGVRPCEIINGLISVVSSLQWAEYSFCSTQSLNRRRGY